MGNSRGSAILQTVLILGLLSLSALYYADIHSASVKMQNTERYLEAFDSNVDTTIRVMTTPKLCTANFANALDPLNINTSSAASIAGKVIRFSKLVGPGGKTVYDVAPNKPVIPGLTILKFQLMNFATITPGKLYSAELYVEAKKGILNPATGNILRVTFFGSEVSKTTVSPAPAGSPITLVYLNAVGAGPVYNFNSCGSGPPSAPETITMLGCYEHFCGILPIPSANSRTQDDPCANIPGYPPGTYTKDLGDPRYPPRIDSMMQHPFADLSQCGHGNCGSFFFPKFRTDYLMSFVCWKVP